MNVLQLLDDGTDPAVVFVPGIVGTHEFIYRMGRDAFQGRATYGLNFNHTDQELLTTTFHDLMTQFSAQLDRLQRPFELIAFSHGFTVAGFCYKEGLLVPTRITGVSPIISREDWLDIWRSREPWGPYKKDVLLQESQVDFSNDTRRTLKGTQFHIPVLLLHGTRDEYFYDAEGNRCGSNNIDDLVQPNVTVARIEGANHYLAGRSFVAAKKSLAHHLSRT
jgi:hypothetical protein